MALNMVHKYTHTEPQTVPNGTVSGDPIIQPVSLTPGVALTSEGGATTSEVVGPYTISGIPSGGIGLADNKATVATDGAFRFDVTGADDTVVDGEIVYAVMSGAAVASLTLTESTNIPFGKVDRFIGETSATETSVWIGRFVDSIGAS